jgi:hypothetical protein
MEDNNLMLNPPPVSSNREQELAILFMEIRNFLGLTQSQPDPQNMQPDFDYLLAISG